MGAHGVNGRIIMFNEFTEAVYQYVLVDPDLLKRLIGLDKDAMRREIDKAVLHTFYVADSSKKENSISHILYRTIQWDVLIEYLEDLIGSGELSTFIGNSCSKSKD